jgi:hypothetical protein
MRTNVHVHQIYSWVKRPTNKQWKANNVFQSVSYLKSKEMSHSKLLWTYRVLKIWPMINGSVRGPHDLAQHEYGPTR